MFPLFFHFAPRFCHFFIILLLPCYYFFIYVAPAKFLINALCALGLIPFELSRAQVHFSLGCGVLWHAAQIRWNGDRGCVGCDEGVMGGRRIIEYS